MADEATGTSPAYEPGTNWRLLARIPGILFATAALITATTGAFALTLPAAPLDGIEAPRALEPPGQGDGVLEAPPAAPAEASGPATKEAPFRTGDRLSDEDVENLRAYIAAMKEAGLHKGAVRYVHA